MDKALSHQEDPVAECDFVAIHSDSQVSLRTTSLMDLVRTEGNANS